MPFPVWRRCSLYQRREAGRAPRADGPQTYGSAFPSSPWNKEDMPLSENMKGLRAPRAFAVRCRGRGDGEGPKFAEALGKVGLQGIC